MAETSDSDSLVKKELDAPAADPIISRTTSSILLICALLLTGVLAWALYDEVYGQRPWKSVQRTFVSRYNRYLRHLNRDGGNPTEKEARESEEFKQLDEAAKQAAQAAEPEKQNIDKRIRLIDQQLAVITDPFQDARGRITVLNYNVETASESEKKDLRGEVDELKNKKIRVEMPGDDGKKKKEDLDYTQIETLYNNLKDEKARLLVQRAEVLKEPGELAKKRDDYLKENVVGLSRQQVTALQNKTKNFDYKIRQISDNNTDIVDRCETCHLGAREPLELTPANMKGGRRNPDSLARAFVSHPRRELLEIHNPDKFGCSSCHGGNGRATTSVVKAHGRHKYWLYPMHQKENVEAGCQQCHSQDRVLLGADTLNLGKDLFQERGCVGCHRYEGFDRETDLLTNARQSVKQLEDQIKVNDREARQTEQNIGGADQSAVQRLLARAEQLRVTNSQLEARIDQLNIQSRYLMQDQKKVGPNLKDVRLKLRKEWIPYWLKDPQGFRPGTKMPTFWRIDGEGGRVDADRERENRERNAIAAYLWQESFEGRYGQQPSGDAAKGKTLFETRGCLACHSVGEGEQQMGGDFAANLTRVGEKSNYEYIVHWIHNPRQRWRPYCPTHKRDLTPEDYASKGKKFVFDTEENSRCPIDGAELQVQNMTVMPNFRLSDAESRDIATYLFSLSGRGDYPDASFMDDANLKQEGHTLIKQYGCAGCHEIKGFEDEQRIGKELTAEGSTPIERLDFALLTHDAERGIDPHTKKEGEPWYNRRGFFENKLETPWIYDEGKEKEPKDMLRMPEPYLTPEWKNALTTFLLGSVGLEGSSVPQSLFYQPTDRQRDIQEGWWVIKKYNCMGCHSVQIGQNSVLSTLNVGSIDFRSPEGKEQLPPALTTEGARVDPDWLLSFLRDPSLSGAANENNPLGRGADFSRTPAEIGIAAGHGQTTGANNAVPAATNGGQNGGGQNAGAQNSGGQNTNGENAGQQNQRPNTSAANTQNAGLTPQPGLNRNGVRPYLQPRMPTFNFSPNELRALVRFFMAVSSQEVPYIKEPQLELDEQEKQLARALFTSQAAPCLKCHVTGDPARDRTASAPNFLMAGNRLKPEWTLRWLLDPQRIIPGTAMPSGLFKREGERHVFNGPLPSTAEQYEGDHAKLLVRYMLQLTPDEQRRLASIAPAPTSGTTPPTVAAHRGLKTPSSQTATANRAARSVERRGRQQAATPAPRRKNAATRERATRTVALWRRNPNSFTP